MSSASVDFPSAPGLLAWQLLLGAYVLGILALRDPLPALAALALVLWAGRLLEGPRVSPWLAAACLLLGLGQAWLAMPQAPQGLPAWMAARELVRVAGMVEEVRTSEDCRLLLTLDNLRVSAKAGEERLGGRAVVTWRLPPGPAQRPRVGQAIDFPARLRPVDGFDNPGCWDTRFQYARQGVFWRAWIEGAEHGMLPEGGSWADSEDDEPPQAEAEPDDATRGASEDAPADGGATVLRDGGGLDAAPRDTPAGVPGDAPGGVSDAGVATAPRAGARTSAASRLPLLGPAPPMELRDVLADRLTRLAPLDATSQGGALLAALMLGDRSGVSAATRELMAAAGVAHVMALSGSNLGLAAGLGFALAWLAHRLRPSMGLVLPRRKLGVLLAAPLVALYIHVGGGGASLTRAGLMFGVWGALLLLGRGRALLDGLFLAVAAMLAVDPLAAYDVSLRLSVVAVAGIAVGQPACARAAEVLCARLPGLPGLRGLTRGVIVLLGISLCASLATLPLTLGEFGEAAFGLHWNLLWVPALGALILPAGFAALACAPVPGLEPLAHALAGFAASALQALVDLLLAAREAGHLSTFTGFSPTWPVMLGSWGLALCLACGRRRGRALIAAACAGLMLLPPAWALLDASAQRVRLTLLDVGQGQGLLLETPGGGRYLVDGGGFSTGDFDVGRAVVAKVLTHGRPALLSGVVLSHPDTDHAGGLAWPVARLGAGFLAWSGRGKGGQSEASLLAAAWAAGVPEIVWSAGSVLELGGGARLEVLHPAAEFPEAGSNDESLVLRLTWNGRGLAVIPGDVQRKGIAALLASGRELRADVLVLPHHGSSSSHSAKFLDRVKPRHALASAGMLNRFDLPSPRVRRALDKRKAALWTTSERGAVTVTWDGPAAAPEVGAFR